MDSHDWARMQQWGDWECHDFRRSRSLSLFGQCSAVDVTNLLVITDPFFIFHLFCIVFLHTWFQSHQLHVVYLTLFFPSCPCRRLFDCMFVYYVLVCDGFYTHFHYFVILVLEFCEALIKKLCLYQVRFSCA